jgi:hypothetical protein
MRFEYHGPRTTREEWHFELLPAVCYTIKEKSTQILCSWLVWSVTFG